MKIIASLSLTLIVMSLTACTKSNAPDALSPTDLTIVVTDKAFNILDCVVVPNTFKQGSVTCQLPVGSEEIRVFALGTRLHEAMPKGGYYITGRPDNDEWMGLGYVEAVIENSILISIDGNGYGSMELTDKMKSDIKKDMEEAIPSSITTIQNNG